MHCEEQLYTFASMDVNTLRFVTFCIGMVGLRLGISPSEVYRRFKSSGMLKGYIIPAYDVLHTFGADYVVDDLVECMKRKGVA